MIELDVASLRDEGLKSFKDAVETRVRLGPPPDTEFVRAALLGALTPLLRGIIGNDVVPEDHVKVHITSEVNGEGQTITLTECEGLSSFGEIAIEGFMNISSLAQA